MGATMVTGGLGYVGRHLVGLLASRGETVVSYNRDYSEQSGENVTAVQGELYDIPRLLDTFRRHDVERIVHTAAMSHPDLSIDLPITTFTANVDGTLHVFEAARVAGVRRIVNFSSECAYGHHEAPLDESAPLHPTTPYGVTKVATELMGHVYNDLYGLDVISLRVTEVYGRGNPMPEILCDILRTVLRGEPFRMESGGDHGFHFVDVRDVAEVAALAAQVDGHGQEVYNVTGGRQLTLNQAADLIREIVPGADIEIGPGFWHLDRQGPWSIEAAGRDLGYRPRMTVEEGIREYADWLRDHPY